MQVSATVEVKRTITLNLILNGDEARMLSEILMYDVSIPEMIAPNSGYSADQISQLMTDIHVALNDPQV